VALAFTDVAPGDDYSEAIADLSSKGIINGFDDGTFRPRDLVTRQQFAKMIVLTLGLPVSENDVCRFSDVQRSDASNLYPDNYVAVCAANNITKGKTANTFDPYSNISRAQVMSMVVRSAPIVGITLEQPSSSYYADTKKIMRNYDDPNHGLNAQIAEVNGLLWGIRLDSAGWWDPGKNCTRGEVAQILWRLMQKIPSTNLLAYDDFSDPDSGWAEYSDSYGSIGYTDDGFYRIGLSGSGRETMSWWGQEFDDAYYEAWAWPYPDSGSWEYGLMFRFRDSDDFYELSVMGDGTAAIWMQADNQWTRMSEWIDLPAATNNGWRHLEVVMVGDAFAAYVDGVEVGEFTDSRFATGQVGFYVSTSDENDFAVYFDEFAVWGIVY
jgi:hypothetical protein